MFGVFSFLLLVFLLHRIYGEDCTCPAGYIFVCDKTVAISLQQACTKKCLDFVLPTYEGTNENACSLREEVMSKSRPSYIVGIKYHQCYCLHEERYKPVCTTTFVTYLNECTMMCIKPDAKKAHEGACVAKTRALSCSSCFRNMHPVCANDGKTYPNACTFGCFKVDNEIQDIMIAHDGACTEEDSPYIAQSLQQRTGLQLPRAKQSNLEDWLIPMIDSDKKGNVKRARKLDRNGRRQ